MLKILMKKQLTEIFRSYFYNPKNNKSRSKAAVAGYIALFVVLMVGVLGGMFTMLALGLCGPLAAVSIGGATTFDTTLPVITQAAGRPYAVVSIFHGCALDFSVPFLVTFFCTI